MRLCLSCRRFSPGGAAFCGHCGRSFDGRLCKKGHVSPPGVQYCVDCGKAELTEYTRSVGFGWLSRLLAWVCVLLAFRWLALHPLLVQEGISIATACVGAQLPRMPLSAVEKPLLCTLLCADQWCLAWVVLIGLVPGEFGKKLRQGSLVAMRLFWRAAMLLGRLVWSVLHLFFRGIRFVVEGRQQRPSRPQKSKPADV